MPDSGAPRPILLVVAAVIVRKGRVLLGRRPSGAHLEHHWEFPGGKIEPGEDPAAALVRELREELGADATVGTPFAFNYHEYPGRRLLLLAYTAQLHGEARPLGCAELGWFDAQGVAALPMPPADGPILERLLPVLSRTEDPPPAAH